MRLYNKFFLCVSCLLDQSGIKILFSISCSNHNHFLVLFKSIDLQIHRSRSAISSLSWICDIDNQFSKIIAESRNLLAPDCNIEPWVSTISSSITFVLVLRFELVLSWPRLHSLVEDLWGQMISH
uniref:Uncharacterized protein n=1 Tax=Noccaea caerulescens TaxID=107243 RepID=A0A1J3IN19_NOCCA